MLLTASIGVCMPPAPDPDPSVSLATSRPRGQRPEVYPTRSSTLRGSIL